jgi:hypothetical protein
MSKKLQQPQIDLKSTTGFEDENGNKIFQQGFILRKVSKFVAGTDEDAIMPIPVFFEPKDRKNGRFYPTPRPKRRIRG